MAESNGSLIIECLDWARTLSTEELREALQHLNFLYKARQKEEALRAAILLRPGDWVEMLQDARKLRAGDRGHVTDIRRDKIDVHFPERGPYTMPASMVKKTDPPATPTK